MPDSGQIRKTRKKPSNKPDSLQEEPEKLSREKQNRLKELDNFIENVLEEAGEDFLDRFKQIEGQ